LGSESLGLFEVLDFHNRVSTLVNNLEGPRLNVLLDDRVLIASANETSGEKKRSQISRLLRSSISTYLISKMVFWGFMAA
jgi:hypothetical protein